MTLASEEAARAWLAAQGFVDALAMERLMALAALLREENQRQNLVSAASLGAVWLRHIVDSAQLLCHVSRETAHGAWLDLGSGAGFPGLVIAALLPDSAVVLAESRPRRCDWLARAAATLGLASVRVASGRVEAMKPFAASVISARAFAPLPRLLDISAVFSTTHTRWLLPKGRGAAQELAGLSGWRHRFHVEQSLTDAEAGIILGELLGHMPANKGMSR